MLEDAALLSRATDWEATDADQPTYPQCGAVLHRRGRETRTLTTHYDQPLQLLRRYAMCPRCEAGLFPLDEELQLLAGHYTPTVYEDMTRLATWMPFARAVKEMAYFRQTSVTAATVRRQTEAAGAAYVAVQEHEVERLERDAPPAPKGLAQQFLSVDGAFVPLVGGEWAEVKTALAKSNRHGKLTVRP